MSDITGLATLTDAELQQAHGVRLAQLTPRRLPNRPSGQPPRLILVGAQQAAGKTRLQNLVFAALDDGSLAVYDGDDNAGVHPRFERLVLGDPASGHGLALDALRHTEVLHAKCLDHLRAGEHQYDVLASQPLAETQRSRNWVTGFLHQGYRVSVVYIATHTANSTLGLAQRFHDALANQRSSRWIDTDYHDECYQLVPVTAQVLEDEGLVHDLYVVDRSGYVLYENHRDGNGNWQHAPAAGQAILAGRNSAPTPTEHRDFWASADRLLSADPPSAGSADAVRGAVLLARARMQERPLPQAAPRGAAHRIDHLIRCESPAGAHRLASAGVVLPRPVVAGPHLPSRDPARRPNRGAARERAD